jgi:hypothetical protein
MTSSLPANQGDFGAPHSPALLAAMAAQLRALAADAEALGAVLCSDFEVVGRYLVQLQQIDRLAQSLREMAGLLNSADPEAAIAEIRLGALREALCEPPRP